MSDREIEIQRAMRFFESADKVEGLIKRIENLEEYNKKRDEQSKELDRVVSTLMFKMVGGSKDE